VDYPDIGKDLFVRTQEVLLQRNLSTEKKPLPPDEPSEAEGGGGGSVATKKSAVTGASSEGTKSKSSSEGTGTPKDAPKDAFAEIKLGSISDGEEEADNMSRANRPKNRKAVVEPDCEFLCWVQFEDFVEVFNRIYIIEDISWLDNYTSRRYCSTWVVGDYVAGSGGPPGDFLAAATKSEDIFGVSPRERGGGNASPGMSGAAAVSGGEDDDEDEDEDDESEEEEEENGDPFTDNPMYPFSVTEPTDISIALFQVCIYMCLYVSMYMYIYCMCMYICMYIRIYMYVLSNISKYIYPPLPPLYPPSTPPLPPSLTRPTSAGVLPV
jgi:hypothetical protein